MKVGNKKIKGSKMKKVLGTALLAAVLGATSLQAAITSKEALNIAEKNFPGSSVKDIEMNVKKGVTFYKIESFKDGVKQEIKIDANSGQIVKVENKNKKHILPIEAVDFSKFALSIDAWIYKVELKRDRSEKKVIIDAQNGEIIGNYTK